MACLFASLSTTGPTKLGQRLRINPPCTEKEKLPERTMKVREGQKADLCSQDDFFLRAQEEELDPRKKLFQVKRELRTSKKKRFESPLVLFLKIREGNFKLLLLEVEQP